MTKPQLSPVVLGGPIHTRRNKGGSGDEVQEKVRGSFPPM